MTRQQRFRYETFTSHDRGRGATRRSALSPASASHSRQRHITRKVCPEWTPAFWSRLTVAREGCVLMAADARHPDEAAFLRFTIVRRATPLEADRQTERPT
jgi:hypothetical protein